MAAHRPAKIITHPSGIPIAVNISLAVCYTAIHLYQFFVLPMWLLPLDGRWAWTLLALAVLNNPFWSLIHEAIHDLLHPKRNTNLVLGERFPSCSVRPFGFCA